MPHARVGAARSNSPPCTERIFVIAITSRVKLRGLPLVDCECHVRRFFLKTQPRLGGTFFAPIIRHGRRHKPRLPAVIAAAAAETAAAIEATNM